MPVRRRLFAVDVMKKAAGNFLLFQVLQNTEIASLIMIDRMTRAFVICAGTVFFCVSHFILSSGISPSLYGCFQTGSFFPSKLPCRINSALNVEHVGIEVLVRHPDVLRFQHLLQCENGSP